MFTNLLVMSHKVSYDKLLIKKLKCHNEEAFRKLYDLYKGDVYAYSRSFLKQDSFAEEIVQEVFLKIWINRTNLDEDLNFKSYLFTITRNLTLNFLRKAANDKHLMAEVFYHRPISSNPIEHKILEDDFERIKQEAISMLPPRRKRIFEMSRFEGKSYEEISSELDISISTVKNQMSKALETMREFLRANGDITVMIAFILAGIL